MLIKIFLFLIFILYIEIISFLKKSYLYIFQKKFSFIYKTDLYITKFFFYANYSLNKTDSNYINNEIDYFIF